MPCHGMCGCLAYLSLRGQSGSTPGSRKYGGHATVWAPSHFSWGGACEWDPGLLLEELPSHFPPWLYQQTCPPGCDFNLCLTLTSSSLVF